MMNQVARRIASAALASVMLAFCGFASADPPTRVMRLSYLNGAVSFAPAGSDDWVVARLNRPLVQADRVWVDRDARGELAFPNGVVWLGSDTAFNVINLDDRLTQLEMTQGDLTLRVRRLVPGETVEIDTPNLAFVITRAGRYRVSVDSQGASTFVAVREGAAEVYGDNASYVVARGQAYRFYGNDVRDSELQALAPPDALERFAQDRERRFERTVSSRYVSPEVIGYEDLDRYGTWSTVSDYGNAWFPRETPRDWAPYRDGHWSWIDPWGWTWVDDAPWGFAPFHYGRWVHADRGWGWVPGPVNVRAVYAPALVAFVGGGGASVAVSSGPSIGWFPLAPREVYRPPYQASREYFRQVNVSNTTITNVTVINNVYNNPSTIAQVNQYVNLRAPNAVTAVPPAAMAQSQNVSRAAIAVKPAMFDARQVVDVVRIAPAQQAVVGAAPAAQTRPPAALAQRAVVARTAPPPPPPPLAARVAELQKDPGKPLERPAAPPVSRPGTPVNAAPGGAAPPPQTAPAAAPGAPARSNIRVVDAAKPAANAAPPAKAPNPSRAPVATPGGQDAPGGAQTRPGVAPAPSAPPAASNTTPSSAPTQPGATPAASSGATPPGPAPARGNGAADGGNAPQPPGAAPRGGPQAGDAPRRGAPGSAEAPGSAPPRPVGEGPKGPPAAANAPAAPPANVPPAPPAGRTPPPAPGAAPAGPAAPAPAAAPPSAPPSAAPNGPAPAPRAAPPGQ